MFSNVVTDPNKYSKQGENNEYGVLTESNNDAKYERQSTVDLPHDVAFAKRISSQAGTPQTELNIKDKSDIVANSKEMTYISNKTSKIENSEKVQAP